MTSLSEEALGAADVGPRHRRAASRLASGAALLFLSAACASDGGGTSLAESERRQDKTDFGPSVPFSVQLCFAPQDQDLAQDLVNERLTRSGANAVEGVTAVSVSSVPNAYAVGVQFTTSEAREAFLNFLKVAPATLGEGIAIQDATAEGCPDP